MGEVDWAEVFIKFLSHTGLTYEAIAARTIPQLIAMGTRLEKHIEIKAGRPLFGGELMDLPDMPAPEERPATRKKPSEGHTVNDGFAFAAMMNS